MFLRKRPWKYFLLVMYNRDRKAVQILFFKLDEIYPSKLSALRDISKDKPIRFKVKFYLYSFFMDKDSVIISENMKTMCPAFSIIIPHKDIPDLLMRCLRSIPVFEDIQVIVVDDNSADADTYLERYQELSRPYLEFVRTTKGKGAGYARNVGLDHAKGKWLLFADADDFFVENMSDIIYSYVDSEADVIYFKIKSVLSEDINIADNRDPHVNRIIDQYLMDGDEWPLRAKMYSPWAKMIKRSLMVKHGIRFDEVMYGNDAYCSVLIGYHAKMIKVVDRVIYIVTRRPNSLIANCVLNRVN